MDHDSGSTGLVNFTDETVDKSLFSRLHKEDADDENSCLLQPPTKERQLSAEHKLEPADRKLQLAKEIGLQLRQVANPLEKDYGCLKSGSDTLTSDLHALFNEIDKLTNQAASEDVPQQPNNLQKNPAELLSDDQLKKALDNPIAVTLCQQRFVSAKQMTNLSNFTHDLLIDIAKWLKKLEDFTCFRSASKSLHVAVKDEHFEGLRLRQGTPYLMLPVRHDGTNDDVRELYSLVAGESTVASLEVPKLKSSTMCYESLGWLLAVQADGSMSLLDPLSNTEIPLPNPDTMPEYEQYVTEEKRMFIKKMVLSSRPNETSDFILMVICGDYSNLAFWRSGEETWNMMVNLKGAFSDVVYDVGEQFYALNLQGTIWVINLAAGKVGSRIIIDLELNLRILCDIQNHYILKTIDGSLLCIKRRKGHVYYLTCEFKVYVIDTEKGTCKEIDSLGSMAIFLGRNSSIALDTSKFPAEKGGVMKANHIYFTDDFWEFQNIYFARTNWRAYCRNSREAKGGSVDSGVYNLETEAVEPIYPVEPLLSNVCPAMWITPNLSF